MALDKDSQNSAADDGSLKEEKATYGSRSSARSISKLRE